MPIFTVFEQLCSSQLFKFSNFLQSSFDEKNVTLGPQQGFGGWRGGSGSSSLSKTGSGGYSMSDRDTERKAGVRSSTPTMMNRFSALSGQQQQQQQQLNEYEHGRRQKPGRFEFFS